jgi:type IV pilus assembly protein PilW
MKTSPHAARQAGVTLIELMVAMVLGLLVAAGIVTVFASTNNNNKAQTQLATLQEEGRFAMARIKTDLSVLNSQYGGNTGGNAAQAGTGQPYQDGLRSPLVYAHSTSSPLLTAAMSDLTTKWGAISGGTVAYPTEPTTGPYSMPSFFMMRGYDCTTTTCLPIDPSAVIPAAGKAVGNRVLGTDVLTIRYLNPNRGWAIAPSAATGTTLTLNTDGSTLKQINLKQQTGEPPITDVKANDLIMMANYSGAQIFAVSGQGTNALVPTGANYATPTGMVGTNAIKVFDFNTDFQTVTYYLEVVDNGNGATTGGLFRRVNGGDKNHNGVDEELVRGVERLDFRYGVIDNLGNTRFLTADQVDNAKDSSGTAIACPPGETSPAAAGAIKGCLWRAVQSIEVDLLMDGQIPLYTLTADEQKYTYSFETTKTLLAPDAHTVTPTSQGFVNQMLRREFTAMIAVRNYNP